MEGTLWTYLSLILNQPESKVARNERPLCPEVSHYWDKVAQHYKPLAFQVGSSCLAAPSLGNRLHGANKACGLVLCLADVAIGPELQSLLLRKCEEKQTSSRRCCWGRGPRTWAQTVSQQSVEVACQLNEWLKFSKKQNSQHAVSHSTGVLQIHKGSMVPLSTPTIRGSMPNIWGFSAQGVAPKLGLPSTPQGCYNGSPGERDSHWNDSALGSVCIWVVVKIMVPFWVIKQIRHLGFRGPKREHEFDNRPYFYDICKKRLPQFEFSQDLYTAPATWEGKGREGKGRPKVRSRSAHPRDQNPGWEQAASHNMSTSTQMPRLYS